MKLPALWPESNEKIILKTINKEANYFILQLKNIKKEM